MEIGEVEEIGVAEPIEIEQPDEREIPIPTREEETEEVAP